MPECGFFLTRIFPYKDRIVYFKFIREDTGQRKAELCIFYTVLIDRKNPTKPLKSLQSLCGND